MDKLREVYSINKQRLPSIVFTLEALWHSIILSIFNFHGLIILLYHRSLPLGSLIEWVGKMTIVNLLFSKHTLLLAILGLWRDILDLVGKLEDLVQSLANVHTIEINLRHYWTKQLALWSLKQKILPACLVLSPKDAHNSLVSECRSSGDNRTQILSCQLSLSLIDLFPSS